MLYRYGNVISETQIEHNAWQFYRIFEIEIVSGYSSIVTLELKEGITVLTPSAPNV